MSLLGKPIESIEEAALQALKDNEVPEGKTLDYKQALPGTKPSDKKEFLADVAAFANATGGHILFGMEEKAGVPVQLSGVVIDNPDDEVLRLDTIIQYGITPKLPRVTVRAIPLSNGNHAVVIEIPRSWARPHMVIYQGTNRFYVRRSAGKDLMDVPEIRSAFVLSEAVTNKVREFRSQRLADILVGEVPFNLPAGAKTVLHLVPLAIFDPAHQFDVAAIWSERTSLLQPLTGGSWNYRYNFDGVACFAFSNDGTHPSYIQAFRNGAIEAVTTLLTETYDEEHTDRKKRVVRAEYLEGEMVRGMTRFLQFQEKIGVQLPVLVMISLLDVRDFEIATPSTMLRSAKHAIDRDHLLLPDILIEDFHVTLPVALKPAFDAIWNAADWPGSPTRESN